MQASDMEGREDLLTLNDFSEESVLHNIKKRFQEREQIYTQIGAPILISMNPYKRMPIFTVEFAQKVRDYSSQVRGLASANPGVLVENPGPHLFMIAEDSFQSLITDQKNQSIIITGESGAGKTEACKFILAYVARAHEMVFHGEPGQDLHTPGVARDTSGAGAVQSVETYVLDSNPLMEAFGNAKTTRNVNSSRFGKFIQVNVQTKTRTIQSAQILTYLLEKSRAVSLGHDERSFHIFYQGLASPEIRAKYQLASANPADYGFLRSPTGTYTIEGVNDEVDYGRTMACMRNLGFTEEEIDQIWQILAAILNLGNVDYRVNPDNDEAHVQDSARQFAERAAALLQLDDTERMFSILQNKVVKYPGQVIKTPFLLNEAISARNSCAKTIYGKLFTWIVGKINQSIMSRMSEVTGEDMETIHSLGLLDIFGFESFKINSFEQICINYANEKLQQHFNSHMIALEMNEYKYELGADAVANITFEDSSRCLELFESRTVAMPSLFKLIDEEGQIRGNDENLLRRMHQFYLDKSKGNPHYQKAGKFDSPQFKVQHYAGDVVYDIAGFTEKNKDLLSDHIIETLQTSSHGLMQILFPSKVVNKLPQRRGTKLGGFSLSSQFLEQMQQLMKSLDESVPRYVRCIKPNKIASPDPTKLDEEDVTNQLRAASILECVRIRKVGYGYRIGYEDFIEKFWPIMGTDGNVFQVDENVTTTMQTQRIFDKAAQLTDVQEYKDILQVGSEQNLEWQCGTTKLCMKDDARLAIEAVLNQVLAGHATKIQSKMRQILCKKQAEKRREARDTILRSILAYIYRKRWRDGVMKFASQYKAIVVRLQRAFRKKRFRRLVMEWVAKRRKQAILIQRVWRGIENHNSMIKFLVKKQQARIKLQRTFAWRLRQKSVMAEIQRRIELKAQMAERIRSSAVEESEEVNVLKQEKAVQDEKMHQLQEQVQALLLAAEASKLAKEKEDAQAALDAKAAEEENKQFEEEGKTGAFQILSKADMVQKVEEMEKQLEELKEENGVLKTEQQQATMTKTIEELKVENQMLKQNRGTLMQAAFQKKIISVLREDYSQVKQQNEILAQDSGVGASLESHGYF